MQLVIHHTVVDVIQPALARIVATVLPSSDVTTILQHLCCKRIYSDKKITRQNGRYSAG